MNNIKNTWKRVESIITNKNRSSDISKSLSSSGSTITSQVEISNIFDNYFTTIAEKEEIIKPSHKHFSDFLKNRHQNSFLLSCTRLRLQNTIYLNLIQINQLDLTACL